MRSKHVLYALIAFPVISLITNIITGRYDFYTLLPGLIIVGIYWAILLNKSSQRDSSYLGLTSQLKSDTGTFRVKYCSADRFNSWMKFFPWESYGLLSIGENFIEYRSVSGKAYRLRSRKGELSKEWVGSTMLNGSSAWFKLLSQDTSHYFTADTGVTVLGTEDETRKIYSHLDLKDSLIT